MRMMKRLAVAVIGAALTLPTAFAFAVFSDAAQSSGATISTGTLAPSSGLTVSSSCIPASTIDAQLDWIATPSTFGDGYIVMVSVSNGPFNDLATVTGRLSNTFRAVGLKPRTTYDFQVIATASKWRSLPSNTVGITTPKKNCN